MPSLNVEIGFLTQRLHQSIQKVYRDSQLWPETATHGDGVYPARSALRAEWLSYIMRQALDQRNHKRGIDLPSKTEVATYTNRMGDTYYLHEGRTKTGKVRYFVAKTPRGGMLSTMPKGFEFSESINGVVSVRKIDVSAARVPESDIALVHAEMARHHHLCDHRIDVVKGEIVVFEPTNSPFSELPEEMARIFPMGTLRSVSMRRRVRYNPVMKFVPSQKHNDYSVHRMTYRGKGGWSWPLASGSLHELLPKFLHHVGTDEFFELL